MNLFFLKISLFVVVVLIRSALVASRIALIKLRYATLEDKSLVSFIKTRTIGSLLKQVPLHGQVINFSVSLSTLSAGALAYSALAEMNQLCIPPASWLLDAGLMGMLGALFFLIGDRLPRLWGFRHPQSLLKFTAGPLLFLTWMSWPLQKLGIPLRFFRALTLRKEKADFFLLDMAVQTHALGAHNGNLSSSLLKILKNLVAMRELEISDVLIPRYRLRYMDLNESLESILEMAKKSGHTRFPLCQGDLDHCLGIIHIKDLFQKGVKSKEALLEMRRQAIQAPLEEKLEHALQRMLKSHTHMLLAIDEFGGTAGAITLEDILEQLVGHIQDEFDHEETPEIRPTEEGTAYWVSGATSVHDLENALNIRIPNNQISTFSGLITAELGRIPQRGETLTLFGMEICVEKASKTRVLSARLRLISPSDAEEA